MERTTRPDLVLGWSPAFDRLARLGVATARCHRNTAISDSDKAEATALVQNVIWYASEELLGIIISAQRMVRFSEYGAASRANKITGQMPQVTPQRRHSNVELGQFDGQGLTHGCHT